MYFHQECGKPFESNWHHTMSFGITKGSLTCTKVLGEPCKSLQVYLIKSAYQSDTCLLELFEGSPDPPVC
jgi:hypothetical protein